MISRPRAQSLPALTRSSEKSANRSMVDDLDAAIRARGDARRREDAARRTSKRTAKAAQGTHLLSMPRMAGLMTAGALLGSATALAGALGIQPRSLRAKTGAERGVSCDDLRAAADALEARAALMIEHAAKLRGQVQA